MKQDTDKRFKPATTFICSPLAPIYASILKLPTTSTSDWQSSMQPLIAVSFFNTFFSPYVSFRMRNNFHLLFLSNSADPILNLSILFDSCTCSIWFGAPAGECFLFNYLIIIFKKTYDTKIIYHTWQYFISCVSPCSLPPLAQYNTLLYS